MERWTVPDLLILADAIAAVGLNTFAVRRALQRMERGEITALEAVQLIAAKRLIAGSANCHLIRQWQTASELTGRHPIGSCRASDRNPTGRKRP